MSDEEVSLTKARLIVMLDDLLSGEGKLRHTSRIPLFFNEHAPVSILENQCHLQDTNNNLTFLAT